MPAFRIPNLSKSSGASVFEWFIEVSARWVSASAAVISVICTVLVMRRTDADKSSAALTKLSDRMTKAELDLSNIQVRLDGMPSKGDFEGLKSDVRALGRDVEKVDAGVSRIESFLIEKGSK